MRLNIMKVEDLDMRLLKDQLLEVHKIEESLDLVRLIVEKFHIVFVLAEEIKIARVFLMLTIDCIDHKVKDFEMIEGRNKLSKTFDMLFAELHFLSGYSSYSCKQFKKPLKEQEEREARELIFKDVLETLGAEDVYPSLPNFAKNLEQANQVYDIMEEKIHDLELVLMECSVEEVPGPTDTTSLYARYWRGQIHHDLSFYQEEPKNLIQMCEKSMQLWNALLAESFTKENLRKFARTHPNAATHIFLQLTERNRRNFKEIINFKTAALMESDPEDPEIKPPLYALNLLRKDYILQMILYLDYFNITNDILPKKDWLDINERIAVQYRSIILKNQKNQKQNLDNSIPYLLTYNGMMTLGWPILPTSLVDLLCEVVDQNPFIMKFRQKPEKFEDHLMEEKLRTLSLLGMP